MSEADVILFGAVVIADSEKKTGEAGAAGNDGKENAEVVEDSEAKDGGDIAEERREGGEDEGPLLAAPARREDGSYLTVGAKDKYYTPVNVDRRKSGARKRSYHGVYSRETASPTLRNVFKGSDELQSLARGTGLSEQDESNYSLEENKVFAVNHDVVTLIEELESKNNETKT